MPQTGEGSWWPWPLEPVHWSADCPQYRPGDSLFNSYNERVVTCRACIASPTSPEWWRTPGAVEGR